MRIQDDSVTLFIWNISFKSLGSVRFFKKKILLLFCKDASEDDQK